jgi:hypothetical protein
MNAQELTCWLADEFSDWIDGDDFVVAYAVVADNSIDVTFIEAHTNEGERRFNVKVTEL